jgi:small ligand-binding sensory domain FIST
MTSQVGNNYAAAIDISTDFESSLDRTVNEISRQIQNPDVLFVFVSGHSPEAIDEQLPHLSRASNSRHTVGCTAESLICNRQEVEQDCAVALWAASLPEVDTLSIHVEYDRRAEGGAFVGWPDDTLGDWPENSYLILLADPYTFPADVLLQRLNEDRPHLTVMGGMASGADVPGKTRLLLGERVYATGAVGLRLSTADTGRRLIRPIVSQGCRPIGEPLVVTRAEQNVILSLGGKSALAQLTRIFNELPTREKKMAQTGLHIGRVINEYQGSFQFGDFLIRNVFGIDRERDGIVVAEFIKPGQTIQFHIRDDASADQELRELLAEAYSSDVKAALVFSCNGRGTRLFPVPHHDAMLIDSFFPEIPACGIFAAGEIGPVGGKNFLHGFTASIALLN